MKKFLCYFLSILLLISLVPVASLKAEEEGMPYMFDGKIKVFFVGKAASSGIRYKTTGWIISRKKANRKGEIHTEAVDKAYIRDGFKEVGSTPVGGGQVRTDFEVDKDAVDIAMHNAKMGNFKEGDTIYMSAIMKVNNNGSLSKEYLTLSGIKGAQSWASPGDLDDYYDLPVPYASSPNHELNIESYINGTPYKQGFKNIAKSKSGVEHSVKVPASIVENGKKSILVSVHLEDNLARGKAYSAKKNPNNMTVPGPDLTDLKVTTQVGGTTVVAKYFSPVVMKIEHYNLDTSTILETSEVTIPFDKSKENFQASAKSFPRVSYLHSDIMYGNSTTWKDHSDIATRTIPGNQEAKIRFNYSANTDLIAGLKISADPASLDEGKKATIKFELDASATKHKNPITKYEWWLSEFEDLSNPIKGNTAVVKFNTSKSNILAGSKLYGKVKVTDSKGKTSEALADITIEKIKKEEVVNGFGRIDKLDFLPITYGTFPQRDDVFDLCDYIDHVAVEDDDTEYTVYLKRDPELSKYIEGLDGADSKYKYGASLGFDLGVDSTRSWTTNGIDKYKYTLSAMNIYDYGVSKDISTSSNPLTINNSNIGDNVPMGLNPYVLKNMYDDVTNSNNYADLSLDLDVNDSKKKDAVFEARRVDVIFRFNLPVKTYKEPTVNLFINETKFAFGQDAEFTTSFVEDETTYKIDSKRWEIRTASGDILKSGDGVIPDKMSLFFAIGNYKAEQFITYKDLDGNDIEVGSVRDFEICPIVEPSVKISCDKKIYYLPTEGFFNVEYINNDFTLPIDEKSYKLYDGSGKVIASGVDLDFPSIYKFGVDLDSGMYKAEQTITWYDMGVKKTKSSVCEFRLVSPYPITAFDVDMKMTSSDDSWKSITDMTQDGKQFRQIRVDLNSSTELNKSLLNPHPVKYNSSNTIIQVIPLNDDGTGDYSKVPSVLYPQSSSILIEDKVTTFRAKDSVRLRFDKPGKYKVRAKVANEFYTSKNWCVKEITIKEDLAPKVSMSFDNVIEDKGIKTYRLTDNLHAKFNVKLKVVPGDDDIPEPSTAKLFVSYDSNSNNDTNDDGVNSNMLLTKSKSTLQEFIKIDMNSEFNSFDIDMFSNNFSMLGKVEFNYEITEKPTIPYFIEGDIKAPAPITCNTRSQDESSRTVLIDNKAPNIKVVMGKESKINIYIIMEGDQLHFDIDTLKAYYKDTASIYLIDKNGTKHLIQ